ncbi:hypothetical protein PASLES2_13100 [Pseudomonas aeruginosa]
MSQDDTPDRAAPQVGKVAPEAVALRAQPRPVTRLNRRTLAMFMGGLSVAVLGATIWSLQPHRRGAGEQTELYNVDRVSKSEGLDGLPADYSKLPQKVPELGPPLPGDLGPAIVASQQPVTPTYVPPGHDPEDALRKEADAAAASSVFFRSGQQGNAAAPATAQAAAAATGNALAGFDPLAAGPASMAAQPADPTATQNRQDQKEAFLKGGSTETRNSGNLQMPASPYQVMAGTVIAAALVTGIKSDLPGDVIGTVTEPVYDSATGKFLLIPQGSRILGKYNSQVSYGQSRVQVVWNRIILPDTSSLTIDNLVGTDPAGYSGLEDGVDYHWGRIVAGAALTTLLGVGAELAAPENRQDGNRIVIAGRDSAQDSINQVGQEMTRRNMNIQPTLTERPGLPVRIIVNRDLVLRPLPADVLQPGSDAMSTGKKLRLGPLPKLESTKMTFACPASLRADLDRYAALHAQTYGEAVDAATLIPHMLEAFMAGDRGFKRTHAMNGKAARVSWSGFRIGARGRNRTGTPFGEGFSSHFDFRRRPTQRRAFVVWSTPSP